MARGGRRENAGRNRLIDHLGRMRIGSECEKRFQQLREDAQQRNWNQRRGVDQVHQLQTEFRAVKPEDRRAFRESAEGLELSELVEQAIRDVRRTPDFVNHTNRFFTLTAPRPKGVKKAICEEVAGKFSAEWGIPELSPRYAQRCWDEYRAFEKETRLETD